MFQQNHYQQQPEQEHQVFDHSSAGSMNGLNHSNCNINAHQEQLAVNELPKKRSDVNKEIFDELYELTLTPRQQGREPPRTGRRQNRNEVLAVLIACLIKHKHLNGNNYLYQMNLFRDIQMNSNNGEFVLVLRTDGRIVVMSDEVEQHLGKPMRSLYTQCRNILECLDQADRNKLRLVLNTPADSPRQEHRLVCTFRLPKGRRPSRVREDIKTITMAGHFYSCHESSSTTDRLFIARCEALISTPTNKSNSLQTNTMINNHTNSTLDITLNEDMSIISVSPNTKNILGYANKEMDGIWIGRYLVTSDLAKLVTIWQKHFQQQLPTSICEIFDMYTSNGEGRLTFLCQIRPIRQRRSKSIKFEITGQLIDPSLRNEYAKYVHSATETNSKLIKAKQCRHQYQKRAKIQSWPIARHSSTWPSSYSTTPPAVTAPINTNPRHSIDHCQMLLHRSTSMMNLGNNCSIPTTTNIHSHQQLLISITGQQNHSMMTSSNTDPMKN